MLEMRSFERHPEMEAPESEEIRQRKAFLQLTPRDQTLLQRYRHWLLPCAHGFVRGFYRHLSRFAPFKPLLADPARLHRLRAIQQRYFRSLLQDRCDAAYIRGRLRIGEAHQRIGLDLKWYTGAYAHYLSHLLPRLWRDERFDFDTETRTALTGALIRKVFFDMGLGIDTYVEADRHRIEQLKTYAERIIDTAPCGLVVTDARLRILTANPKFAELCAPETVGKGVPLARVLPIPGLEELGRDLLLAQKSHELRFQHHNRQLHIEIAPIELGDLIADSETYGLIFSLEDLTEQTALQALSRQRGARLDAILNNIPDGIVVFRGDGTVESWNPALETLLGCRGEELKGRDISELLLQQRYRPLFAHQLLQHLWRERRQHLEALGQRRDGALVPLEIAVDRILASDPPLYLAVLHDLSERKQAEADLHRLAHYDPLTRLPNRTLYLDRLRLELVRARRHPHRLAVLFLDLDDFKKINDSLGHLAGDKLLQEVAQRLCHILRECDTVARFGGDEFTLIATDLDDPGAWRAVADKILTVFQQPFRLEGRELFIRASIGVSLFPEHGNDPHTLLRHADTAMYRAKFEGRNRACCYDPAMEAEADARVTLESELHRALERQELAPVYQPQIRASDDRIAGCEVLLRWHNARLGNVAPSRFIPVLESLGLIAPVGEWVLDTALRQARCWRRRLGRDLPVAVNVSSFQMKDPDFAAGVLERLRRTGHPPEALELEITESILMESSETTLTNIDRLKRGGVRLAIDDFGTGYSSLSYLHQFPFDTLKIDRSFIQHLDTPRNRELARHIVSLGHTLELEVVAEGVETQAQLQTVRELGCDLVQGYVFYRPLAAAEFEAALRQRG